MKHDKYHLPGMTYGEASIARAKGRAEAKAAREALAAKVKVSPIALAVAPLKNDAMDAASAYGKEVIDKVAAELAKAGMDRELYAPYPKAFNMGKYEYRQKQAKYALVRKLTRGLESSRRPGTPDICVMDEEFCEKFITECREQAAGQYENFVAKLVHKIGDCESAKLSGNHVWSNSLLKVVKADGSIENWKTQQITNRSVLGKYFPQWPSRQVKGK
jgi:hypothetical protein